jgi:hypothetical protein
MQRGVQNSKSKVKGMSPGAKHQSEAAWKGRRPVGTSGGPTHPGRSPVRTENRFPKVVGEEHRAPG